MKSESTITAALVGNPNCGKTTLFNILTGSSQRTGNWAGVTVEKKYGYAKNIHGKNGKKLKIVDLPGIYSLYPYSPEETAAIKFLLHDKPDVIINIIDSTNLERNLYLTTQLIQLGLPVVAALNMFDILEKRGDKINVELFCKSFGILFVPISAAKGFGIDSLLKNAVHISDNNIKPESIHIFSPQTERALAQIQNNSAQSISKFEAVRLFESGNTDEPEMTIADERYKFICSVTKSALVRSKSSQAESISDKIDKIITSRVLAIPIFLIIMSLIFYITFGAPGQAMKNVFDYIITDVFEDCVKNLLISAKTSAQIQSLVLDGIIGGVGSVISFLPQITILFTLLSLVEDSGYMARTIFITDKLLRRIGLSGKSFVPIIMGFGCTVPAVLSTKTLENPREKQLAILISPFMSCSAKMPVYMLFASVFFKENTVPAIFAVYIIGIAFAVLTALFFKEGSSQKSAVFLMELPPYRLPSPKSLFLHIWERIKDFLAKAGKILLGASIIIWFLQSFDFSLAPAAKEESILSQAGRFIAPIFSVCGFDSWQASVSLLTGLVAKESVASTIAVLCSDTGLSEIFSGLSAFSFLVFVLLYPPCIAATAAVYKETKSLKKTAFSTAYQLFSAWFLSALIFQVGTLIKNIGGIL